MKRSNINNNLTHLTQSSDLKLFQTTDKHAQLSIIPDLWLGSQKSNFLIKKLVRRNIHIFEIV